jgi:hypothetical protein
MPGTADAMGLANPFDADETRAYVAKILGLLGGAGEALGGGLQVKLVE